MIYTKIKHAEKIRKLYKLQSIMAHKQHQEIGSRLGFQKYSRYYYELIKKLHKERVLDEKGVFIDNTINLWLTELSGILSQKEIKVLGGRVPFSIYLDLFLNPIKKNPRDIHDELRLTRSSTYYAIEKLASENLIERTDSKVIVSDKHEFFKWLTKYVELCLSYTDITKEIFILFDLMPAYIDGPQAFYMVNYEPGRPIGTSNMIIRTHEPYVKFWKYVIDHVSYFNRYPKQITVLPIEGKNEIIWMDEIPYDKNAKEE